MLCVQCLYLLFQIPQLTFVSVMFVFIVIGNCSVLAAIQLSKNGRKTRMNFFIMHLAIADLLVGIICVSTDLMSKITVEWHAGNAICKILQYLQAIVTYSSTFVLVSLSIDRYDAVARPMNFSRSAYQARVLISLAWIAALVFALPAPFLYQVEEHQQKLQCWMDFPEYWHWQLFFTLVSFVTFILPALIISACYIAIIYIIWNKGQNRSSMEESHRLTEKDSKNGENGQSRNHVLCRRNNSNRGIIPQAKIRTIKMTLIIVIVFILCWSPFFVYNLLELYEHIPRNDPLSTFVQSAAPLNSAANPIIYGIFSTRICTNLRIPVLSCLAKAFCGRSKPRKSRQMRVQGQVISLSDQTFITDGSGSRRLTKSSNNHSLLANRRPSGLPVVRKTLSPRDNLLLKTIVPVSKQRNGCHKIQSSVINCSEGMLV
ncbi:cardioacceleratory peptide receptor [Patella vulgata]|uniref:cardioacceleratory peptide receptor n=1 Tax=Patella vulgata TaxID=6465 RepID=UPI00218064E1|nr:cardioacceleratory peptide receptor [Patella vulgata]